MQTFLPEFTYGGSAKVLDRARLGKQRVECMQIMKALATGKGWINHPCTKMWAGHEGVLLDYTRYIVNEWKSRGYKDTCYIKTLDLFCSKFDLEDIELYETPEWELDRDFHDRHKSMLLQKNFEHYSQFRWQVPLDLKYKWWCPDEQAWYELEKKGSKNIRVWL